MPKRKLYDVPNKCDVEEDIWKADKELHDVKSRKPTRKKNEQINPNLHIDVLTERHDQTVNTNRPYYLTNRDYVSMTVTCTCRLKIKIRVLGDFEYYCRCAKRVYVRAYIEDASP